MVTIPVTVTRTIPVAITIAVAGIIIAVTVPITCVVITAATPAANVSIVPATATIHAANGRDIVVQAVSTERVGVDSNNLAATLEVRMLTHLPCARTDTDRACGIIETNRAKVTNASIHRNAAATIIGVLEQDRICVAIIAATVTTATSAAISVAMIPATIIAAIATTMVSTSATIAAVMVARTTTYTSNG